MNNNDKPVLISIVGPTAVGKTKMAIDLALEFKTEIVSADSRQFYNELNIGTAKPTDEELEKVKHHFINSHSISKLYSAGKYGRDAEELLNKLFKTKKIVLAVGGSSLYLKALWEGFDEIPAVEESIREKLNEQFNQEGIEPLLKELSKADPDYYHSVDKKNYQRVIRALEVIRGTGKSFSSFRKAKMKDLSYRNIKVGLNMDRAILFDRIDKRMDLMIGQGLFEEARSLYRYKDHNALQTVGYSEIFDFMDDQYGYEEAVRLLKRNSRRYAKRQLTWFRKYEDIVWFRPDQKDEIISFIRSQLN